LFRPWRRVNATLINLASRISQPSELSRTTKWLLGVAIAVLVVVICYAIYRLWPYMEGFEQYGYLGAFLVAFITSITVIFPLPGFAIIAVIAANPDLHWAAVALAAAIGGGLGESTAYLAGYAGAVIITPKQTKWYTMAEGWMRRYGSATIFVFAFSPLPFDVVGIAAGALRFPFWKFLLATTAGRLPKTLIGVYLVHKGWQLLPRYWDTWWDTWTGLPWWSWVIIGVNIAVIIGGAIILWRIWRHRQI
jgi:membrane protein YqaA with SNARE-associated domain